jgi:hypothetical protein
MKKLLTSFVLLAFTFTSFAQDGGSIKNFRFGGTMTPSITWYKPDNLKKFSKGGSTAKFGFIINGEYSFSDNFAFGFGIGIGSAGGKITFTDTANYYFSNDEIITVEDTNGLNGKYEFYKLNDRTYKASYFYIPLSLKMRTKEIGALRYFFQPAFTLGIRKKVRADDELVSYKTNQSTQQTDLDITKDMNVMKMSVLLSAGGEYYLSGSTAFTFAIGYDYGLSNVVQSKSEYLIRTKQSNYEAVEQKFNQGGMVLSLGILF